MAFHNAGILIPNVVSIEKCCGSYNRVYVGVYMWHDTEIAYNFIMRLCNPLVESRFVYNNENELWWVVHINKFPHKLFTYGRQGRSITIFNPSSFNVDEENREPTWTTKDFVICYRKFGRQLTFDFETEYNCFMNENYAWVDELLEKQASDNCYKYEVSTFDELRQPFI